MAGRKGERTRVRTKLGLVFPSMLVGVAVELRMGMRWVCAGVGEAIGRLVWDGVEN